MTANTPIHAFTDDALGDLDATGVAARIESGEVTAREVMEASIARAEAVQGQLNGLACTDFDRALARSNRPAKGVFAGVPTAIKDNTDSAGLPTQQAVPPSPRSPPKPTAISRSSSSPPGPFRSARPDCPSSDSVRPPNT